MKQTRAVLDAGVLVSALLRPQGPPGGLLRQFVERQAFDLVVTEQILEELREALADPDVRRHLDGSHELRARWSAALGLLATQVKGARHGESDARSVVVSDPADDKYVEAAVEAGATLIVSNDRHLLEADVPEGIEVVTPRVFLELLELEGER